MPTFPSSSVEDARKALAGRLREIRRDSGLSARRVAELAQWQQSKCSRLENAVTVPSDSDIRTWCRVCSAESQIDDLIAATRSVDSMYVEWRRVQRTGLKRLQESFVPLYERTRLFRVYCSNVMPGLFQTTAYATALLERISEFHQTPNDAEAAAAARVDRARILRQAGRQFAMVVEEGVLRYRIGDVGTMAAQLGHLLSVMSLPAVSLGVIPFTAERRMWPLETFMIFDHEVVQVELLSAAVSINAPSQLAQYESAFSQFAQQAVYGASARMLITSALAELDRVDM